MPGPSNHAPAISVAGAFLSIAMSGPLACGAAPPDEDIGESGGIDPADTTGDVDDSDEVGGDGPVLDLGASADLPSADGEECVTQTAEATLQFRPVDVILVVDTSGSMDPVSSGVEMTIGTSLAQKLAASGLDYRVIAVAGYGGDQFLCLPAPLGNDACAPPGPLAPVGPLLFQYSVGLGSGSFLAAILTTYTGEAAVGNAALYDDPPVGWGAWLRPDALKVFVAVTDAEEMTNATAPGDQFDADLLALAPEQFGTIDARNYVFHTVAGMTANVPPDVPWPPDAPIVNGDCAGFSGKEPGQPLQQVSVLTGGLRFPLCEYMKFDKLFDAVATGVEETLPVACDFAFPEPPEGETLDPDTLEVDYQAGDGAVHAFHQVPTAADCDAQAFWVDDVSIHLCPAACTAVQSDDAAALELRFGCDVGYEPSG
jgi:hypothetical protein